MEAVPSLHSLQFCQQQVLLDSFPEQTHFCQFVLPKQTLAGVKIKAGRVERRFLWETPAAALLGPSQRSGEGRNHRIYNICVFVFPELSFHFKVVKNIVCQYGVTGM